MRGSRERPARRVATNGRVSWWATVAGPLWRPWIAAAVMASGCAGVVIRPEQLPAAPQPAALGPVVLSLGAVPDPMKREFRDFAARASGAREIVDEGMELTSACASPSEVILRPALGREHFNSNAGDRNTLFIYESAIVVGIPVTLISAVSWPWYGEMMKEGRLEWTSCAARRKERDVVTSVHLRSEGRGFIRGGTIKEAQETAALRALARKLLARWTRTVSEEGEKP